MKKIRIALGDKDIAELVPERMSTGTGKRENMTDNGWFSDGQYIVESAWGRFQDTPIFRALARQHNVTVTKHQMIGAIADGGYPGEWVVTRGLLR